MISSLLDLPAELINLIIDYVHLNGCRLVQAILPLSSTCKLLRCALKPLIFATVTVETEACYFREYSAPRWLYRDKLLSLADTDPHAIELITDLKFICWQRYARELYTTRSWAFPEHLLGMIGRMQQLQNVSFAPPHAYTEKVLEALRRQILHIVMDYRLPDPTHLALESANVSHSNSTFSIAAGFGSQAAYDTCGDVSNRLRALQWSHPVRSTGARTHVELLHSLHGCPMLEELHVSERVLDLHRHLSWHASYAPQICSFISTLPLLQRVRIEGANLTRAFLEILPSLTMLQDLSIYSVYRRVFHQGCDENGTPPQPTTPMPWLKLPNLRKLDLRFVCKHFDMQQLIPSGLVALRLEFYGAEERLTLEDIDWLVRNCPDLERLELDIGWMGDSVTGSDSSDESSPSSSGEDDVLARLKGLPKLRTLRLFPSYWRNGKLLPHPFPAGRCIISAVKVFLRLLSLCSNLRTLIISISFGEYPFDVISKMWLTTRPAKFVLKNVGAKDDVLVQWGYAAHHEMYELVYKGEKALPGVKSVPSSEQYFFDDLNEDWILPHYELYRDAR